MKMKILAIAGLMIAATAGQVQAAFIRVDFTSEVTYTQAAPILGMTPSIGDIISGYIIVIAQTAVAPRAIIPLAYDSGGVTTSTVTVPLVAALGLGLAETIPGRSALLDGFGLIAFASLFPMISVMAYAQISEWRTRKVREAMSSSEDKS